MRQDRGEDLTEQGDAALVEDARRGHSGAFDELYRRHAPAAWRAAVAITSNPDDAADAVADAFSRVLAAVPAGRLSNGDRFRPYLLAATRNAAIDVLRRAGRTRPTDAMETLDTAASGRGPSEWLMAELDASLVSAAFRSLPERWRSVLWLTEVEGIPPREAAGILGVSANGVSQLAVRARAGLRERYLQAHLRDSEVPETCRPTTEALGAHAVGGLSPRDVAKVDQHLAGCPTCRGRLDDLQELGTTLRRAALPLPLGLLAASARHWRLSGAGSAGAPHLSLLSAFPMAARKPLVGVSIGLLGLGIIGASVVGQPALPAPAGVEAGNPAAAPARPTLIQPAVGAVEVPSAVGAPLPTAQAATAASPGAGSTAGPGPAPAAPTASLAGTTTVPAATVPAGTVPPATTPGAAPLSGGAASSTGASPTSPGPVTTPPVTSPPGTIPPVTTPVGAPSSPVPLPSVGLPAVRLPTMPLPSLPVPQTGLHTSVGSVPVGVSVGSCTGLALGSITAGCTSSSGSSSSPVMTVPSGSGAGLGTATSTGSQPSSTTTTSSPPTTSQPSWLLPSISVSANVPVLGTTTLHLP